MVKLNLSPSLQTVHHTGKRWRFHIMNLADSLVIREGNTYFHYLKK